MPAARSSRRDVADLLNAQSTLALATCDADGTPGIAPLFYLPDSELRLYWFSSPASAHSRNLKRDPRASVTVFTSTANWREIRGVQMRGTVRAASDPEIRRAYIERFRLGKLPQAAMASSRLYCFEPSWIRYVDNTRGFGYTCTVER